MRDEDGPGRRRADAVRNREAILAAGLEVLTRRPDAGLAEIARAGGVTRTTVYAHFDTREQLVEELLRSAVARTVRAIDDSDPDSGPSGEALLRILAASWQGVARLAALADTLAVTLGPRVEQLHAPVRERLAALVDRGRREGAFRADVPEGWLLTVYFALVHAAAREVAAGLVDPPDAEQALCRTLLGAFAPPAGPAHRRPLHPGAP
jgi:TetR/AcrR family transcriptional regulator, mexCD-oprJ operon repressor